MKTTDQYLAEIKEIRKIMEQSSRFLSLSGLSGILVGVYAIIGALIAYRMIYLPAPSIYRKVYPHQVLDQLILLAAVLLLASFITVIWLTTVKTKKTGQKFWNTGSRLLCINLAIPLISGGILILIFTFRGIYSVVAPFCLVFYGLALVNAAKYTRQEIFYMACFKSCWASYRLFYPDWALFSGLLVSGWYTSFTAPSCISATNVKLNQREKPISTAR